VSLYPGGEPGHPQGAIHLAEGPRAARIPTSRRGKGRPGWRLGALEVAPFPPPVGARGGLGGGRGPLTHGLRNELTVMRQAALQAALPTLFACL
jgi:hypothetical protein